jgi:hypothetical protein
MLQQCTNKSLTTDPLGNNCEVDEFLLEVEVGGLKESSVYNLAGTKICDNNA